MVTFAVVLRSGGDYTIYDSICLSRQVARNLSMPHRFVCLTDTPFDDEKVECVKLKKNWPGWWSVVEVFRLNGPTIFMGLDTIIYNSIDILGELALTCPSDVFYMLRPSKKGIRRGKKMTSGITIWNGDWHWLFDQFKSEYMHQFKGEERYTEWQLLRNHVDVRFVQDYFKGMYSYKRDIRGKKIPNNAAVIAFHGKPRPSQCEEPWAKEIRADLSDSPHSLYDLAQSLKD